MRSDESRSVHRDEVFVGRHNELASVASGVAEGTERRATVVWVEGDAGEGKSALVRQVIDGLSPAVEVWWAHSDQLATDLPLGVAAQLVEVDPGTSGFAAGLALLRRIGDRHGDEPLAVVVEDLHWADLASRQALLTAVRRLGDDRVVLIVTSRPPESAAQGDDGWDRFVRDSANCRRVRMGPLNAREVADLAQQSGVSLGPADADRLHRHTLGHPLYVATLLAELSPEELSTPDGELPAPRTLALAVMALLDDVPPEARRLIEALAVINQRVPVGVAARVAGGRQEVGEATAALDALWAKGLVTWSPTEPATPVEMAHPLVRSAVYEGLSPSRRQALHRAAGDALDPASALAHRVAAAEGADDELAAELEMTAGQHAEESRSLAARYWLWASSLSSSPIDSDRRLRAAARTLLSDGQVSRVAALRSRLTASRDSAERDLTLGLLAWEEGKGPVAERWLRRAVDVHIDRPTPPTEVLAVGWARLAWVYSLQGRASEGLEAATRGLTLGGDIEEVAQASWWALAVALGTLQGSPAALDKLAERLPQPADAVAPGDVDLLVMRGTLGFYAGRTTAAISDLRVAVRLVRHGARSSQLPRAHLHLAQLLAYVGEWDEALLHAHLTLSLVAGEGQVWMEGQAHAAMVRLLAARGQWDEAAEHLAAARRAADAVAIPEAVGGVLIAQAILARARGEPRGVIEALAPMAAAHRGEMSSKMSALNWWPLLVVALIETGDINAAQSHLERLELVAQQRGVNLSARIAELRGRVAQALGNAAEADAWFQEAIGLTGPDDAVLERAQLHHAYGRLLLAQGRRRDALDQLRVAHELVVAIGAAPFRSRIDADLEASGIRTSARRSSRLALTERESDVVSLVIKGLTNREVAGELYVSLKAVEFHLRNIYGKLGVRNRRELRRRLTDG